MLLADAVSAILQSAGVGTEGTDLFIGRLPETPASAVAVIETGGPPRGLVLGGTVDIEQPSCQIVVRATSRSAGALKARDVFDALTGYVGAASGQDIQYLQPTLPVQLGDDAHERVRFSLNVEAVRGV